jgi:rRNA maturation RNase YbeY
MDFIQFPEIKESRRDNFIEFFFEDIESHPIDEKSLQHWIEEVVSFEKKILGDINIIFCSDSFLHKINLEYLNHDTLTDIITFQYSPDEVAGELYISLPRVFENSVLHNTTEENELHRVIIHGILHLCGYLDKTPDLQSKMRAKEDWALTLLP